MRCSWQEGGLVHSGALLPVFLLISAGLSLGAALVSQYGFGLHPCILCIYQRVPYGVVIGLGALGLALRSNAGWLSAIGLLAALAFVVGAAIAFYHAGVEYRWWQGTENCGAQGLARTVEDLRAMIMNAPVARCDEPAFVFLGLSMAGWNALWSLGLAATTLWVMRCGAARDKR